MIVRAQITVMCVESPAAIKARTISKWADCTAPLSAVLPVRSLVCTQAPESMYGLKSQPDVGVMNQNFTFGQH